VRHLTLVIGVAALAASQLAVAFDQDRGKDHPLLSRYPGSTIQKQVAVDFDEYALVLSAPTNDEASFARVKKQALEGKLTRTSYDMPDNASLLAAYRSYEQALAKAGFQTLFQCRHEACGSTDFWSDRALFTVGSKDRQYYLAAKRGDDSAATYVALHISQNGEGGFMHAQLDILEQQGMATGLIQADTRTTTNSLDSALKTAGKASIYDLYFDTGKAELKPDSKPALDAIAQVLKAQAALKLYVVGHTDTVGVLSQNSELSQKRASTVVDTLVKQYGIAKERLSAHGVGPLAPIASNIDETGRSRNRRVELVRAP
jgi:OmpA-OmpF porin, OOP family